MDEFLFSLQVRLQEINLYTHLAEFLKTYLKMGQNIRTESWR